jgi:hypothetical protein
MYLVLVRARVDTSEQIPTQGYEASQFVMGGYNHHDLCFPDGTCPTDDIVEAFLQICESSEGVVAIHCKVTHVFFEKFIQIVASSAQEKLLPQVFMRCHLSFQQCKIMTHGKELSSHHSGQQRQEEDFSG